MLEESGSVRGWLGSDPLQTWYCLWLVCVCYPYGEEALRVDRMRVLLGEAWSFRGVSEYTSRVLHTRSMEVQSLSPGCVKVLQNKEREGRAMPYRTSDLCRVKAVR